MSVTLVDVRKVVEVSYDTSVVKGDDVSLLVTLPDGTEQEKRVVPNKGTVDFFVPQAFTGAVTVTLRGTAEGEETGTVSV